MKKLKLWYYRNFKVISNEKAKELGLVFWENVYGDSINHYGCRSIWFDYRHKTYRVEGLVETRLQKAFPKQDIEKQNKTAVEWLKNNFETNESEIISKNIEVWFKIAIEMEKKQLFYAWDRGYGEGLVDAIKVMEKD